MSFLKHFFLILLEPIVLNLETNTTRVSLKAIVILIMIILIRLKVNETTISKNSDFAASENQFFNKNHLLNIKRKGEFNSTCKTCICCVLTMHHNFILYFEILY